MVHEYKTILTSQIVNILMTYGIKSVNMDDLARHLSISKKTLYKHFKDKNDIVNEVISIIIQEERSAINEIKEDCENAIDGMIKVTQFVQDKLKDTHPAVMFDLQKYYPESFKLLMEHKNGFINEVIINNTHQGIKEGLYRKNITPEIISRLFLGNISLIMSMDIEKSLHFTFALLHIEMVRYHIRGIASEQGITYLKEYLNNDQLNI